MCRQQHHRAKDVGQFRAGPQGAHGAVPGQSVRDREPGFPAARVGSGLPAGHEGRCLSGHGETLQCDMKGWDNSLIRFESRS